MAGPALETILFGTVFAGTSFTTAAGDSKYMIVDARIRSGGSIGDITGAAFGATTLTLEKGELVGDTLRMKRFVGVVPAATTANVVVTTSGNAFGPVVCIRAYTGVVSKGTSVSAQNVGTSGGGAPASTLSVTVDGTDALVSGVANCREDNSTVMTLTSPATTDGRVDDPDVIAASIAGGSVSSALAVGAVNNNDTIVIATPLIGIPTITGAGAFTLDSVTLASTATFIEPSGGAGLGMAITRLRYHRFFFGG